MYNQIKHKTLAILALLLLCVFTAKAQEAYSNNSLSAGLRFNNPFGISVKKNWNDNALELVVGRANPWRFNGYRSFRNKYSDKGYHYNGYDPIYKPLVIQLNYVKYKSIPKISQLSFYYGIGGLIRNYAYDINYTYDRDGIEYHDTFTKRGIGAGVSALAGLEFKFKSIPMTVFYDLSLYSEIMPQPFNMNFNSSWGIRYYWE